MPRMSREDRLAQAEDCLASGLTVREWCAENDVPAPTMYAWLRRLREEAPLAVAPAFVELGDVPDSERQVSGAPIVARVGGVELLLPHGFDESDAAAAMRAAASL
ncbi:MAG: transposase [Atopobiaceae bacterium]|nr:transposase [Atopobiaceae bacterium]